MIKTKIISVELQLTLSDPQLVKLQDLTNAERCEIKKQLLDLDGVDLVMMQERQIRTNKISIDIDQPSQVETMKQQILKIIIKQLSSGS